ncbi:cyanobacterial aminoacyl-tRNA synthetase, CAAD domain-containing protein [Artemisia annua]|uniref:Cyanobacterial aminoacyl-tRNA synthetase, CAAD domain-containing protein n=1 Tax=Artemisia annua TaxID=35608 RepID=A0A2U1QCV5_ARTAN|nr:cyanobacterial aminoacyl-tRNA synthetase, CAAD domain-containing protein [Artemisia annua]
MAASSSMAQAIVANKSPTTSFDRPSSVPNNIHLSSRSSYSSLLADSSKLKLAGSKRSLAYFIKASSEDTSETSEIGEVFSGLKEKWDATENKPMVVIYGGGAVVGVWLASTVIDAINGVPVVPKFMELVGLGYTGWFIYRYLLFKSTRKELADDIEALKKKIIGSE